MKNFTARTESGTTYTLKDGVLVVVTASGYAEAFKPIALYAIDRSKMGNPYTEAGIAAAVLEHGEQVDLPVVGKSLYVSGLRNWRLSTELVEVEEVTAQ